MLVLHELTYVLPRTKLPAFVDRCGVVEYLRRILALAGVHAEAKDDLLETLVLWGKGHFGFTDTRLAVLATHRRMRVCSPNARDFPPQANSFPAA